MARPARRILVWLLLLLGDAAFNIFLSWYFAFVWMRNRWRDAELICEDSKTSPRVGP